MKIYATRTGTKRNLGLMRQAGFGMLLNPFENLSPVPDGFTYACDNGEWPCSQAGRCFDGPAFRRMLERVGPGADFIVAPDIVAGGTASLAMSLAWLHDCLAVGPTVLIPLQDGMEVRDIIAVWREFAWARDRLGLFLGGSTEWKEATMRKWGRLAQRLGATYHVGRVNTARRLYLASFSKADSVDGTSASKFADTIPLLASASRQQDLFA